MPSSDFSVGNAGNDDGAGQRMKLLITGVSGFIGSNAARILTGRGYAVRGLTLARGPWEAAALEALEEAEVEVHVGSITDPAVVRAAVREMDAVLHLAAAQGEVEAGEQHFHAVNVEGVGHVLEEAATAGVRRVVHVSTIGVHGAPTTVVTEDTACAPTNVYGQSKLEGERRVRMAPEGLETVVLRVPETYGPGDSRLRKLFALTHRGRFPLIGSGGNIHQPLYVDDLVDAFDRALQVPAASGMTLVLGGPEALTTREMIRVVAQVVGGRAPRIPIPMTLMAPLAVSMEAACRPLGIAPPLHPRRLDFYRKSFRIDASKARDVLNWTPTTRFVEGARRTAEWYKERGFL